MSIYLVKFLKKDIFTSDVDILSFNKVDSNFELVGLKLSKFKIHGFCTFNKQTDIDRIFYCVINIDNFPKNITENYKQDQVFKDAFYFNDYIKTEIRNNKINDIIK